MDTSFVLPYCIGMGLKKSQLADGSIRFLGNVQFAIEIIPDKSVSLFIPNFTEDAINIVDLYIEDIAKTRTLMLEIDSFVSSNPNTRFQRSIGDALTLTCSKIQSKGGHTLFLAING